MPVSAPTAILAPWKDQCWEGLGCPAIADYLYNTTKGNLTMIYQLRTYTVNKGMMDDWVTLFNNKLVGMMADNGIKVEYAWVNLDKNQFIWSRSFASAEDVAVKEAAFYASAEWNALVDDARSHLARIHVEPMESVLKVPASH